MKPAKWIRWGLALVLGAAGLVCLWHATRLSKSPFPGSCTGEHHQMEVNGVSLTYEMAGEGKPVLLLHGNGGSHRDLSVLTRQLSEAGYRVYAIDSRGQGANAPLSEYHYEDMAEDTYAFIKALGLEKPALYGWSDGGIVGLLTEIRHPGTLGALAISGANLDPEGIKGELLLSYQAMEALSPDPLSKMVLTEPHILPEELQGMDLPVLVTAGAMDMIREEHTRKIAASIPGARLVILEGESHGSYILGSEKMGNLLLSFLEDLDSPDIP